MTLRLLRPGVYHCRTCGWETHCNTFFLSQIERFYNPPDWWPRHQACYDKAKGLKGEARRQAGRMALVKED